jgi:ornithine carbamoyltransferase
LLLRSKDFLSISQLTADELAQLIARGLEFKQNPQVARSLLADRTVALLFQKPSLRTRVSFEVGAFEMGGHCMYLSPAEVGVGEREAVADVARVLSRYVDAIVARTFLHEDVEGLAQFASIPVINGLSDRSHPCQILADLLTMHERFGHLEGLVVAYVGDSNNVTRSLAEAAPLAGYQFRIASPEGYEPGPDWEADGHAFAGMVEVGNDASAAVRGADVIYTDAWFSMGQEAEREVRAHVFPPFRVTADLVGRAASHAIVLHCLPAHRGEEITDEVIEGPHSAVFDQAENRLHAQKALMAALLADVGRRHDASSSTSTGSASPAARTG